MSLGWPQSFGQAEARGRWPLTRASGAARGALHLREFLGGLCMSGDLHSCAGGPPCLLTGLACDGNMTGLAQTGTKAMGQINMDTHTVTVLEPQSRRIPQSSELVGVLAGFLEEVTLELRAEEQASPRSKPKSFPIVRWGWSMSAGGVGTGLGGRSGKMGKVEWQSQAWVRG